MPLPGTASSIRCASISRSATKRVLRGRIDTILDASLRKVLGEVPLFTVLSADRARPDEPDPGPANTETKQFGIDIVDVRIKRTDLPAENSQAIYRRMQTEREREAKELRAQGAELAQRIRSRADRERRVIIAEAEKEGEIIRGEGDADAVRIFADAVGRDVDFFTFYRSMQAYRDALADDNTSFVLSPDSEFFRYFDSPTLAPVEQAQRSRAAPAAAADRAPLPPQRRRALAASMARRPRSTRPPAPASTHRIGRGARSAAVGGPVLGRTGATGVRRIATSQPDDLEPVRARAGPSVSLGARGCHEPSCWLMVAADETDDRGRRVMIDLATAVGLVLVLEGLLWAVSPGAMKRAAAMALGLADEQLRLGGLVAVAVGVLLVWLVRG